MGNKVSPRHKILVIDDDLELLEELKELLELAGFHVDTVNDSSKAAMEAKRILPDLILLDLKMSPKSGFQVADELKRSDQLKTIPAIAMTGFFTQKEYVLMMKLCGIKAFVLKPFNPATLIAKIEETLAQAKEECHR
jgi:DNA-binding response OmpR family regulator